MKKQLTKAEEEIMQHLWELKEANVATIIDAIKPPKPAYNTVSTIIRILESKEFVSHRKVGKGYVYFPIVEKTAYTNQSLKKLMSGYFGGSFKSMVSFFVKENDVSLNELQEILDDIKENN